MTKLHHFKAIPTQDKSAVVFATDGWRMRIAVEKLPFWVRLYRDFRDGHGGRDAKVYSQPTEALEAAAKTLGIPVPDLRPKPKVVRR